MRAVMLKRTKTACLLVAGGAGDKAVRRKLRIIKQAATQFKSFFSERIILKCISRGRKPIRYFQCEFLESARALFFFTSGRDDGQSGNNQGKG